MADTEQSIEEKPLSQVDENNTEQNGNGNTEEQGSNSAATSQGTSGARWSESLHSPSHLPHFSPSLDFDVSHHGLGKILEFWVIEMSKTIVYLLYLNLRNLFFDVYFP